MYLHIHKVMFILIPLGYSDFVAIETFDLETMVQGSHGNTTTIPSPHEHWLLRKWLN